MKRKNSLGSFNSMSLSFDSNLEEKNAETDDETINTFHKYEKIGALKDLSDVKESICTKSYDENGNKYYNEYKVVSFLGSGAYSKIELVEKDGIKYALKIVDKSFLQSQKNIEFDHEGNIVINSSFENAIKEIAILKKTNHPNIIKLHEILYCKNNKKIYLILEYCEHGDLIGYDEESGKFILNKHVKEKNTDSYYKTKEILKFLKDIISGLYYLHSNGIIHRDIKPNNILLDKNNVCKITDFNVSSILENLDDDNIGRKICSADHFRPPEGCEISNNDNEKENDNENVKSNKKPDLKGKPIDIWALGITAYILAYNKFPFESETNNIFELYNKISKSKVEFPKRPKRKHILKHFIKRCLEKDPNKRITIEGLIRFPFCERNSIENKFKFKGLRKIIVSRQEIINSVNFFAPNCYAVFRGFGKFLEKKIDNNLRKIKKYKGKIHHLKKMHLYRTIEDKYGIFEVDGFIFRKEDFGMRSEINDGIFSRTSKRKYFENYKKYHIEDEKTKEKIKRKSFKLFLNNARKNELK